jgi:hypothetical protein
MQTGEGPKGYMKSGNKLLTLDYTYILPVVIINSKIIDR